MLHRLLIFLVLLVSARHATAQRDTLFTIDGHPHYADDFVHVYQKNDIEGTSDFSRASLEDYLDLYIDFRLKVAEAEALGLDTTEAFRSELAMYRDQLADSYVYEKDVTDKLLDEAYERSLEEVRVRHILFQWPDQPISAADSAATLQRALNARKRLDDGADFAELAVELSDDPSALQNQGDLGYITVFRTIYPFETAAYETPVGSVSDPVATKYGYHLVQVVDKRAARGEVTVGHILIKEGEALADSVHQLLANGADWNETVKAFSQDQMTRDRGGLLEAFGTGRMVEPFEDAAFALQEPGDLSDPVETEYGWHIIRLFSKQDLPSKAEATDRLRRRLKRDPRSNMARERMIDSLKIQLGYTVHTDVRDRVFAQVNLSTLTSGETPADEFAGRADSLATFADEVITVGDFIDYLARQRARDLPGDWKRRFLAGQLDRYTDERVIEHKREHLERYDEAFRRLMDEYRSGILIFNLSNDMVWNRAATDTAGLKAFFADRRDDYMWGERVEVATFSSASREVLATVRKLLARGRPIDKAIKKAERSSDVPVTVSTERIEVDADLPDGVQPSYNSMAPVTDTKDGVFVFRRVNAVLPPEPKRLDETRGFVISDYQDHLERKWVRDLRRRYTVEVNEDVLESLIRE